MPALALVAPQVERDKGLRGRIAVLFLVVPALALVLVLVPVLVPVLVLALWLAFAPVAARFLPAKLNRRRCLVAVVLAIVARVFEKLPVAIAPG